MSCNITSTAAHFALSACKAAVSIAWTCLILNGSWLRSGKNRLRFIMAEKRISKPTWQGQLQAALTSQAKDSQPFRLAILGIGNEFNGDDAAGILVLRALSSKLGQRPNLLLLEAGTAPENFSGSLRRFQPDLVILIDSADTGSLPGTVTWLDVQDTEGFSASTHSLPPSVFASYLIQEFGCRVALLGIQVERVGFNEAIHHPIRLAIRKVVKGLLSELHSLPWE